MTMQLRPGRRRFLRQALALGSLVAGRALGSSAIPATVSGSTKPIIDFRARPNTREYMEMFPPERWGTDTPRPEPAPLPEFIRRLDALGITSAVFTGRQSRTAGMWLSNDHVADCARAFPGRVIGIAGIDPRDNVAAAREADRALRQLGLRGLAIDLFEMYPDDRRLYPLYHKCIDHDVPVVLTMGPRMGPYASPTALFTVVADLPELKIVCSHAVYPRADEFIALAHFNPNVYIEASIYDYLPGFDEVLEAANAFLQDQVLYGSGFPFAPLDGYERLLGYPFGSGVLEKILCSNAARLLKLDSAACRLG